MIWLIGGTSNSREVSRHLRENKMPHIVTVATEYGKKLYEDTDVRVGRMDSNDMSSFIKVNRIDKIIDATHPYAIDVSKNSLEVASSFNIPHIRFERKTLDYKNSKKFDDYEEIVEYLKDREGNVLVTTGSNNLKVFGGDSRYYVRILPVEVSIRKAIEENISPKNIIALQGPFNDEFNRAIIKNYSIKYMLTKESGAEGGEKEKIDACIGEDIELLVIRRPKVNYNKVVYRLEDI